MQKGHKIKSILFILERKVLPTAEILDIFLSNYHSSYRKARRLLYGTENFNKKINSAEIERQRFYALLTKLKSQNLIEKQMSSGREKHTLWKITATGLKKLNWLQKKPRKDYEITADDKLKIVVFDIPEKEKWKRVWLREVLGLCGFKMLQRSVWAGKNKIPEEFLADLRNFNMLEYIHIFEVSKKGTLKEIA